MIGFAVYSATLDPDRLYSTGDIESIDEDTTTKMAWAEDQPLDLVVDLSDRRMWWAFEAEHETKARRTGHFIAAYHGGLDLFRGFAEELRTLHDTDGWAIPYEGTLQQEVGFDLWRLSTAIEGNDRFDRLVTRLTESGQQRVEPIEIGMQSQQGAFELVRALDKRSIECTVAVGTANTREIHSDIDLLVVPGASQDFEAQPEQAAKTGPNTTTTSIDTDNDHRRNDDPSLDGFSVRIAGIVLVGLVGFAAYSFVVPQPVRPISGLGMFGGLAGALGAIVFSYSVAGTHRPLEDWLRAHEERVILLLTGGALAGFVYPTVLWEVGVLFGRGGYLFGPLFTLSGSLPATILYVSLLFAIAVSVLGLRQDTGQSGPVTRRQLNQLVMAFGIYGLTLLLATGLSQALWFNFIPAA